jgi:inner membrane protein involved in colicin E2 resistance
LPVETAFILSSAVSVGLVVSYLRLVVGSRFALLEAGMAQLLYQVGFSTAHFFDGYTGLSITVLVVLTLFLLMQLTGRLSWSAVFAGSVAAPSR